MLGKSDLLACRMHRRRGTLFSLMRKVHEFVAAAYALDHPLGLLTDTLAITGARPSQAVRLRVEDLHDHPLRPKLMMPKSAKGGGRNRSVKKIERYSVPITPRCAIRLKAAAKGRAGDDRCCCKATAGPGKSIPARTIIAKSTKSSPASASIQPR